MATTFNLNNTFWAATDVKHLTFQGKDVDVLTINGNTVLLPLDYTATISGSSLSGQTITFPVTKSKLARGLLMHCNVKKIGYTGKADFSLSYTDGSSTYTSRIYRINRSSSNTEDILLDLWYNGNTCMLGGGSRLYSWADATKGATYLSLKISGVSNLWLNEPLTVRVISDWTSREEEDTSTTTTTTTTAARAAAAADAYGFTLIDE